MQLFLLEFNHGWTRMDTDFEKRIIGSKPLQKERSGFRQKAELCVLQRFAALCRDYGGWLVLQKSRIIGDSKHSIFHQSFNPFFYPCLSVCIRG
jgi:hypothetical protein